MLPITSHKVQHALPLKQAASRVSRPDDEESFADKMQRAQANPVRQDVPPQKMKRERVVEASDGKPVASDQKVDEDQKDTTQKAPSVEVLNDAAFATDTTPAVKVPVKAGLEKAERSAGKHKAHAGAEGPEAGPDATTNASAGNEALAEVNAQPGVAISIANSSSVAALSEKSERDVEGVPSNGLPRVSAEMSVKASAVDASCNGVGKAEVPDAVAKTPSHALSSVTDAEKPTFLEKQDTVVSAAVSGVVMNAAMEHGGRPSALAVGGGMHGASKAHVAANSELTVQSYEASASNKLEVGVSGGSLGWLKVRAELGQGGEVHTFLRGASFGAENFLKAQAVDLQAYLGAQRLSVHSVHVEASRPGGWTADANAGGNAQRRQSREHAHGGGNTTQGTRLRAGEIGTEWMPMPQMLNGAGGWLNVLA